MNWDDTDEDVELTAAELSHLQRLTDAEADEALLHLVAPGRGLGCG